MQFARPLRMVRTNGNGRAPILQASWAVRFFMPEPQTGMHGRFECTRSIRLLQETTVLSCDRDMIKKEGAHAQPKPTYLP